MTDLLITLNQLALVPREATDEMDFYLQEEWGTSAVPYEGILAAAPVPVVTEAMLREAYDKHFNPNGDESFSWEGWEAAFQLMYDAGLIKLTEDAE